MKTLNNEEAFSRLMDEEIDFIFKMIDPILNRFYPPDHESGRQNDPRSGWGV